MTLCLRGKVFSALLIGLGAILCSSPAFATQITFSTAQSTPLLYTLTAADLASYDPGGTFGIYDDTVCDTGTIATLHGGTANMDGGSPDTIYYTPPGGYVGSDTVTFFNTTDGVNCVAQQAIVTVYGPLNISTVSLPAPTYAVAYSQTIATTGGLAPITFSRSAGTLPAGLALSSAGLLHGTPTGSGAYSFTVRAVDASSNQFNRTYSGTIVPGLAIATGTLPTPVLSVGYSQTVATTGGTAPIAFSIFAGSLPAGLSINSASGVISGTPTTAGTYAFSVRALDANLVAANHAYSGTIVTSLAIATATLPTPVLNFPYSQTVATTGGTAPIALSITSGALPAGLSINSASGVVSGTPTTAGAYNFTVHAVDANSVSVDQTYSGTIEPALLIATTSMPTPVLGQAYSLTVTTTGGTPPITFGLNSGTLPMGLSISSSGVISGTPSASGSFSFTIYASDATTANYRTFNVTVAPSLTISSTTLPTPLIGVAYSQTVTATGGTAPITFSVTAGALPAGLTINASSGVVSGTPTAAGAYSFTVRAVDASSTAVDQAYSGTIVPSVAITSATLPTPLLGVAYSQTIATTGGTAPITFSVTAGALPAGLSINSSSGVVSGTPTAAGAYTYTIRATDANAIAATQAYLGTIVAGLAISSATLPTPLLGVAYAHTVATTGGTSPIAFAITTGTLPSGLTLNAGSGAINGTPTAAGAYTFTVRATDANAIAATQAYSGTIVAGLAISSATLPTPLLGVAYSASVTAAGGTAPIAFAIVAGALPTGLTLNTGTGAIGGTATAAGAYAFTIRATDANAFTASQAYTQTIAASLAISSTTLPVPLLGVAYAHAVTTAGGTSPIAFAVSAGTLPAGLTLNAGTGALTGTPTSAGAFAFTLRATDANAITASQSYSGTIAASLSVSSATLPTPVIGVAYVGTVTTTGGTAPISFAISAGTLPTGLTLNTATGAISGTPTVAGAYTYTIRATDANAITASQSYSGTIGALPSLAAISPNSGPVGGGTSVSITGTALGGATAVLFGSTPATSFTIASSTSLVATSPAGSGSAPVSVIAPGGTTPVSAGATFTWALPPAVTSISPDSGAFAGGTVVTITGSGFAHATAVFFGTAAAATFSVNSDTSISATTAAASASATPTSRAAQGANARKHPAAATPAAGVAVTVVTAGGTSPATPGSTYAFMPAVVPVPTIARLSPANGTSAGGTSVTIAGTALSGATAVRFGTAAATFSVTNSTSLIALAPAGSGTVDVTVTTPGGTSAKASAAYTYKTAATTVGVTSSSNPAAARTPVTFTATVSSAGATPTGSVRFKDGATVIGTIALAGNGIGEITTSALSIGTHAITAYYGGNARFAPSASAPLSQAIDVPADSQKLRALQLAASKLVAQASGQAISSAIDSAILDGFSGSTPLITPSASGVKLNVAEAGSRHKAGTQEPVGAPVAPGRMNSHIFDAAAPPNTSTSTKQALPREWLVWANVQRTGITHTTSSAATTIYGDQINALAGVTRKLSPNFLVGVLGGYETFDYRDDALAGRLNGNGTTVGAYLGWKFVRGLRFDLAGAHTAVGYDGVAGTAAGTFTGSRSLVSSELIGTYAAAALAVEPSAKVYALWESQTPYTDSLGTPQTTSTFTAGRTSAGAKISTLPKTASFIAPYAGFYADYYFSGDNAAAAAAANAIPLASEKILAGWSARAIAGFALRFQDDTTVTCGVEYGGLGSNTELVKYRCDAGVPFLRARRAP